MTATRASIAAAAACLISCSGGPFSAPEALGGKQISAQSLNSGHRAYSYYCVACHGKNGDGRGPASVGLRTPPRDFRVGTFKFTGVEEGKLPPDDAVIRVMTTGLDGTAMLKWQMPDALFNDTMQYIKTFSQPGFGWRDPDFELGEPILVGSDPWGSQNREEAVNRGKEVYHGLATCNTCHPAYETPSNIAAYLKKFDKPASTLAGEYWLPKPQKSTAYTIPVAGDPSCKEASDCGGGEALVCRFGRCEHVGILMPPDFTTNEIRVGVEISDLSRVIAAGIPGTAMPRWKDALPDKDIWAMAYFVRSLSDLRGTTEAAALRNRLEAAPR